jgi:4-amino-4-deoxy-L-arabinose transferase-like glycosyltransferase
MDAERGVTGTRDVVIDIALLLVVWAAIVALVDPRGDFPLNDDWAYAGSVQMLRDEGVFRLPGWAGMTLITQTVWGVLVTAIAGFSYTALRASTLVLGGAALVATYLLARQMRAARAVAVLAALVLAANPLFIVLAHTFMTDVPMLALTLYALLAFGRALQSGSRLAWGAGTLITIAAVLCRQPGLFLAMGFVATAILRQPDRRRWLVLGIVSLLLGAGALWGYQVVMRPSARRWETRSGRTRASCSACGRWGRAAAAVSGPYLFVARCTRASSCCRC